MRALTPAVGSIRRGRLGRALASAAAVAALLTAGSGEARAQVTCGATLTGDTTLTATDPIVTGTCAGNGLIIGDAITLDCGGRLLRGTGTGTGISMAAGVAGATIMNCVVQNFGTGVRLNGAGSHTLSGGVSRNNTGDGVESLTQFNVITGVLSHKNAGFGFQIRGTGTEVSQGNVALENSKAGFAFAGGEHFVDGNFAILNTADGFTGGVVGSFFSVNTAIANTGDGFGMTGGTVALPNDYSENKAVQNGGNGIHVGGTATTNFDSVGNVGLKNGGLHQCRIAGVACF